MPSVSTASGSNGGGKDVDPVREMGINIADTLMWRYAVRGFERNLVTLFDPSFTRRSNSVAIREWAVSRLKKNEVKATDDVQQWMSVLEREFVEKLQGSRESAYN